MVLMISYAYRNPGTFNISSSYVTEEYTGGPYGKARHVFVCEHGNSAGAHRDLLL